MTTSDLISDEQNTVSTTRTDTALAPRSTLPVAALSTHPGNVREDLHLDDAFVTSIAENGVLVPLRITTDDNLANDGTSETRYVVLDGHRRLAAAIKAGLTEVPVDLATERADDKAAQYLDMFNTNQHHLRLNPLEEADALFAASREGATKSKIRKATGVAKDTLDNALKAARLSPTTRMKTAPCYDMTLEQYALLQEFDDDTEAVGKLMEAFNRGESGQHTAEQIRTSRAAKAEADQALARYRNDGYEVVTDTVPPGAMMLLALSHDGQNLTQEAHRACPGRGIVFHSWDPDNPIHFCADPAANGHQSRFAASAVRNPEAAGHDGQQDGENTAHATLPLPQPEPDTGPTMKFVIEGNRAWAAAATVRHGFLNTLFTRSTATRDMELFTATQLLAMPGPLRAKLTTAPHRDLFAELTGNPTPDKLERWTTGKLPLLSLALIVTAYEEQLGGDSGKLTWREDKFSPCSKDDAGAYFRFLAGLGYELAPIEQSIADGVPYTDETPEVPSPETDGTPQDNDSTETTDA